MIYPAKSYVDSKRETLTSRLLLLYVCKGNEVVIPRIVNGFGNRPLRGYPGC